MNNKLDGISANIIAIDEFKKLNKQGENKMKKEKKFVGVNSEFQPVQLDGMIFGNGYVTIGNVQNKFDVDEIIFNPPHTIVKWKDGTKTIVKQGEGDIYDEEKAFVWAVAKRALGTNAKIDKYIEEANRPQNKPKKVKKNKILENIQTEKDE